MENNKNNNHINSQGQSVFFQSIVDNVPNMIFVKEAKDLCFVLFNKAGEELLGYPKEDMIGKSDYDFFPKDQAEWFIAKDRLTLNQKILLDTAEEPIQTRHKGVRILHTKKIPILDEKGEPKYLLGISEDITEKKDLEKKISEYTKDLELKVIERTAELQKSELKYKSLIETTNTGYVIIDIEGKVIDANAEYVRLAGYSDLSEILGRSVTEWTAVYEKEKNEKAIAQCLKDGYIRNLEIDYVNKHGEIISVGINATIVKTNGTSQIVTLCRDITERKKIQNDLERVNRLMIDRELKMIELKRELKEAKEKLK